MKNQIEDARKALQWFRGTTKTVVDVELEQMVEAYQREKEIGSISLKQLLTERIYLQPFILASFIMFGQQFCGVNFILFNAETIFTQAGSSVDPSIYIYFFNTDILTKNILCGTNEMREND